MGKEDKSCGYEIMQNADLATTSKKITLSPERLISGPLFIGTFLFPFTSTSHS